MSVLTNSNMEQQETPKTKEDVRLQIEAEKRRLEEVRLQLQRQQEQLQAERQARQLAEAEVRLAANAAEEQQKRKEKSTKKQAAAVQKAAKKEAAAADKQRRLEDKRSRKAAKQEKKKPAVVFGVLTACAALILLVLFVLTPALQYRSAENLLAEGDFVGAAEQFAALGDYQDAEERALEANYSEAQRLLSAQNYTEAAALFETLGSYQDSAAGLTEANTALKQEADYKAAAAAQESGDYEAAMAMWQELGAYRDSAEQYAVCGVELEWQRFQEKKDTILDITSTSSHLELMMQYETALAAQRRDEGYYALAAHYLAKEMPKESMHCFDKISDKTRFEDAAILEEDIHFLDLYLQAAGIHAVTNWGVDQKEQLLNQLPDNYRDVAALKAQVAEAQEARKARHNEEVAKRKEEEKKCRKYEAKLVGTWNNWVFYSNNAFIEGSTSWITRKGTYSIQISGETMYLNLSVTKEDGEKYGGKSARWPIEFVSDTKFGLKIKGSSGYSTIYSTKIS